MSTSLLPPSLSQVIVRLESETIFYVNFIVCQKIHGWREQIIHGRKGHKDLAPWCSGQESEVVLGGVMVVRGSAKAY